jgi:hypothetical protein
MQALTNRDNWAPALEAPVSAPVVIPAPSPIPVAGRSYTIAKLTSAQLGSVNLNQCDLLVQVVAALIASGQWTCVRSCDGNTISTANLWTSAASIALNGSGKKSWITLRNVVNGWQFQIDNTVNGGWVEVQLWVSPAAGFTGGNTTGTYPTATDEFRINTFGVFLGTGGAVADPAFKAFVWNSADGAIMRVWWWYGGNPMGFWEVNRVTAAVGAGSWVPVMGSWFSNGNTYTSPNWPISFDQYRAQTNVRTRTPANVVESLAFTYDASGVVVGAIVDVVGQDQATLQYLWTAPFGLEVSGQASPRNGLVGYLADQWWGPSQSPPFSHVPLFGNGDTIDGGQLIVIGQMILPWDGTLNPPTGGPATTDYPSNRFYGRNVQATT